MEDRKKCESELSFATVMFDVATDHYGKDGADIEIIGAIHDILNGYNKVSEYYLNKMRELDNG